MREERKLSIEDTGEVHMNEEDNDADDILKDSQTDIELQVSEESNGKFDNNQSGSGSGGGASEASQASEKKVQRRIQGAMDNGTRHLVQLNTCFKIMYGIVILSTVFSLGLYVSMGRMSGTIMRHRCQGVEIVGPSVLQVSLIVLFFIFSLLFCVTKTQNDARIRDRKLKYLESRFKTLVLHSVMALQGIIGIIIIFLALAQFVILLISSNLILHFENIQRTGTVTLNNVKLQKNVKIERDSENIIHIYASNDYDLYFAQGFATAQERLFQLEFQKRVGRGSLSEIVGRAALDIDKFSRTIGFFAHSVTSWNSLTLDTQNAIQAYVDGINAYLDTNPPIPPELVILTSGITKFDRIDVLAWIKMMAWDQGLNRNEEIKRYTSMQLGTDLQRVFELYPVMKEDEISILTLEHLGLNVTQETLQELRDKFNDNSGIFTPSKLNQLERSPHEIVIDKWDKQIKTLYEEFFMNSKDYGTNEHSNNWVISGKWTKSGKPITANDPHMNLVSPNFFLLTHLHNPNVNAIGAALVGVPGITIGRNEHISWGITNAMCDVQDLFVLSERRDGQSYLYDGEVMDYDINEEIIKVKGESDVKYQFKHSIYGPVINEIFHIKGSHQLALRWTGMRPTDTTANTFYSVSRSKNWEEFKTSLKSLVAPVMSMIYGDVNNNIGYIMPGMVPIRKRGHTGVAPVIGDGTYDYQGYIPFEELPQTLNPSEGYIVTANNRVTPPGYPYNFQYDPTPYRAKRIVQLMNDTIQQYGGQITRREMKNIQLDVKSPWSGMLRNLLEKLTDLHGEYDEWRTKLLNWDGVMNMESQEASVLEQWMLLLRNLPSTNREIGHSFKSSSRYLENTFSHLLDDKACRDQGVSCTEYASKEFKKAIDMLKVRSSSQEIPPWGTLHYTVFRHSILGDIMSCLANVYVNNPGGSDTVNVSPINDNFESRHGPAYRHLIELTPYSSTPDENSQTDMIINVPGIHGNFFDELYGNLAPMWASGKYLKLQATNYKKQHELIIKLSQ